ncbi:DUF2806 domain-containing protein [Polyangium sp. 15x6]|uniref:DUF2806 domain-containing protein n=1 Tax=Polyangium sp. 15x6 TaxID=3042687 RepID=UPI002499D0AF|nr:DUF2806 domain-containing protein [Polyangium sp. 15x6]MDI3288057.1 DUF2806 domain-containing protein [Polyangium sp. 15x6]
MTGQFNINLGFDKLFEMIQSLFGPGVIRRRSAAETAARLSAAQTDIEVRKLGVTAEYEEKKARVLAERDFRQFEEKLRAEELPPAVEAEIIDVPIIWEPEPEIVVADAHRRPFEYIEQKRLRNIKQVTHEAVNVLKTLPEHHEVAEQPVDPDWTARFFDDVKDVSNEDMQKLWGKLLAGEIVQPGRFSLRTLEVLRNLTSAEAQLFQRYLSFCADNGQVFTFAEPALEHACSYRYVELMKLVECGLFHSPSAFQGGPGTALILPFRDKRIKMVGGRNMLWTAHMYTLTGVGIELANLGLPLADEAFVRALVNILVGAGMTAEIIDNPLPETSEDDQPTKAEGSTQQPPSTT